LFLFENTPLHLVKQSHIATETVTLHQIAVSNQWKI